MNLLQTGSTSHAISLLEKGSPKQHIKNLLLRVLEEPLGMRRGHAGRMDPQGFVYHVLCVAGMGGVRRQTLATKVDDGCQEGQQACGERPLNEALPGHPHNFWTDR